MKRDAVDATGQASASPLINRRLARHTWPSCQGEANDRTAPPRALTGRARSACADPGRHSPVWAVNPTGRVQVLQHLVRALDHRSSTRRTKRHSNFQLWGVPIIVGVVFYILGAVTTLYAKRPKIAVSGSGGSGSPTGFQTNNLRIKNTPGQVGVKIGQTVFLGFRLNNSHWFGFPVMREPATGCMARLLDEKKAHMAQLWWRDPENHSKCLTIVHLDSGREAELFLFAQRNDDVPTTTHTSLALAMILTFQQSS